MYKMTTREIRALPGDADIVPHGWDRSPGPRMSILALVDTGPGCLSVELYPDGDMCGVPLSVCAYMGRALQDWHVAHEGDSTP